MVPKTFKAVVAHGALQRLPYVPTASEIQEMKFWHASVRESDRILDPIKRAKNHTARLINMQLRKLSGVTRQVSLGFPAIKHFHPFERVTSAVLLVTGRERLTLAYIWCDWQELVLLTLGKGTYKRHVQHLRRVYAVLHNTGKQYERECQQVRTKQQAIDCGLRCIEELQKIVDENGKMLREAADMAKVLVTLQPHPSQLKIRVRVACSYYVACLM
ncbi:hypothetical protein PsorP6_005113 [Peronosclerospora sorghi]|uniref:Uncharacterized protein n=1 Tax=Peronosclerospora sorghi TaxID=230839 RepID=A0ACC0W6T4_9STRA|nr:hypothetical protein PsorP6_005113 [Peronosclerospora sorghi]